jgi:hypothetical protein
MPVFTQFLHVIYATWLSEFASECMHISKSQEIYIDYYYYFIIVTAINIINGPIG